MGIRGSGIRSDIAIDTISTYDGDCVGMHISFIHSQQMKVRQ